MENEVSTWWMLLRTTGALALVVALIYGLSYFARKFLKPERWNAPSAGRIRVQQVFNLAPKKKLMIVEVEDRRLLLGVCDSSISCISQLEPANEVKNVAF